MQVHKVPVIAFYKLMEDLSLNLILAAGGSVNMSAPASMHTFLAMIPQLW